LQEFFRVLKPFRYAEPAGNCFGLFGINITNSDAFHAGQLEPGRNLKAAPETAAEHCNSYGVHGV
jgi:hypothetical protein